MSPIFIIILAAAGYLIYRNGQTSSSQGSSTQSPGGEEAAEAIGFDTGGNSQGQTNPTGAASGGDFFDDGINSPEGADDGSTEDEG